MKKVIALIRTSTTAQEVESQKQEIVSLVLSDGYTEEDIEIVGGAGASAIKVDEAYKANLEKVYSLIEAGGIESVYAWSIDRIGRNEEILMQFKNSLIKKGVQLVIKNPSLRLLNDDGSKNDGVEIAFTLFATMAKQEMEQKKARFLRAKNRNLSVGKYNGGMYAFGYSVDNNGFLTIDEKEADIVRLIFRLFNSGKYSTSTLAKELNERGYSRKSREPFCYISLLKLLKYKGYTGSFVDSKGRTHNQPAIITEEEYNTAKDIISRNNIIQSKSTKHFYFASKLIVCKDCGYHYQSLGDYYKCSGAIMSKRVGNKKVCKSTNAITIRNLDGILWELTKELMIQEIESDHSAIEKETKEQIAVLGQKISVLEEKLTRYDKKIEEIVENGDILLQSEAIISKRIATVTRQKEIENKELLKMKAEVSRLESNLTYSADFEKFFTGYNSISEVELAGDEKTMYSIVHRYISKVTIEKVRYNNNNNFFRIEVNTPNGLYVFFFNGKAREGKRCFVREPNTNFEVPYKFERIIRTGTSVTTESNERFRDFKNKIDSLALTVKSMQEIWDFLFEEDEIYKTVLDDNAQRVIQYLNQVENNIG